ncbi:MAG: type II toxin-antitoxin system VapC family toxin [Planctomycetes bacterium]|nr:type II toxin-antitoxin system VapC family toxin [Planctomycetota bacterium]
MQVFADTSFFVALIQKGDLWHEKAKEMSEKASNSLVLTEFVLLEVSALCSRRPERHLFSVLARSLYASAAVVIEPASSRLFKQGLELYLRRTDKEWSLVDCTSFVVMRARRLTTALSTDHHFEQAGFSILLKRCTCNANPPPHRPK